MPVDTGEILGRFRPKDRDKVEDEHQAAMARVVKRCPHFLVRLASTAGVDALVGTCGDH